MEDRKRIKFDGIDNDVRTVGVNYVRDHIKRRFRAYV